MLLCLLSSSLIIQQCTVWFCCSCLFLWNVSSAVMHAEWCMVLTLFDGMIRGCTGWNFPSLAASAGSSSPFLAAMIILSSFCHGLLCPTVSTPLYSVDDADSKMRTNGQLAAAACIAFAGTVVSALIFSGSTGTISGSHSLAVGMVREGHRVRRCGIRVVRFTPDVVTLVPPLWYHFVTTM
jgi:hypothetical protein